MAVHMRLCWAALIRSFRAPFVPVRLPPRVFSNRFGMHIARGAVWSVAHPDDGELNKDGTPNVLASVQGVDLVEIWNRARNVEAQLDYAENRWNAGFRFGVAAASDRHSRERWDKASQGIPTSAVFAVELNVHAIIEGLRSGRTGLSSSSTTGPRVMLSTDIQGRGYTAKGGDEVIVLSGTSGHLRIQVQRAAGMQVLLYRRPGRKVGPENVPTCNG